MRRLLLYFHTVRHLTGRQLLYRLFRGARQPLSSPVTRIDSRPGRAAVGIGGTRNRGRRGDGAASAEDRPFRLDLTPWPEPPGRVTEHGIELLGYRFPLRAVLAGHPDLAVDEFLRYQLSSQSYLGGASSEPEAVKAIMTATAHGLRRRSSGVPFLGYTAPHPTSLRLVNWVRVLSRMHAPFLDPEESDEIHLAIGTQVRHLLARIEYETDGNHLIDNAVGLMYGGAWLAAGRTGAEDGIGATERSGTTEPHSAPRLGGLGRLAFRRGWQLLRLELPKQIFSDGAHHERSTMYHLLVLERVLDTLSLLGNDAIAELLGARSERIASARTLLQRARRMLEWAQSITWSDGSLPKINDYVEGIAPAPPELISYAERLGVRVTGRPHAGGATSESGVLAGDVVPASAGTTRASSAGYLKVEADPFEVLFDAGRIGPGHVPGHAHADSLQVLLRHKGRDILVDTGTSSYAADEIRARERGTAAHNTVVYGGRDSSEVWSAFRVARRAKPVPAVPANARATTGAAEEPSAEWWSLEAACAHDGYARYGVIHERAIYLKETQEGVAPTELLIADELHPSGERRLTDRDSRRSLSRLRSRNALRSLSGLPSLPGRLSRRLSHSRRGRPSRLLCAVAYFIIAPELAESVTAPARSGESWTISVGELVFRFTDLGATPGDAPVAEDARGAPSPKAAAGHAAGHSAGHAAGTAAEAPAADNAAGRAPAGSPAEEPDNRTPVKPRIEPWQIAVGYRKQVDTVRIAVPFRGALETHIYEERS